MSNRRLVVLPDWLQPPELPGVRYSWWDGATGDVERPSDAVLGEAEFYVLPYMCPRDEVQRTRVMPRLQVAQALTAGVDDMVGLVPEDVALCAAPGVHDASTAELAMTLILASQRGIAEAVLDGSQGRWNHVRRRSLADARVVVVGWGGVGRALGRRLDGFGVHLAPVARAARPGIHGIEDLDGLLGDADVVVVAVPLSPGTRGLFDARRLARMPDGALLVNVSRGAVVDTDALVAETSRGRLRAALDVTDPEPLPADHPLWRIPGVIITPHVGGDSEAFVPRAREFVAYQLRRWLRGEDLVGLVQRSQADGHEPAG